MSCFGKADGWIDWMPHFRPYCTDHTIAGWRAGLPPHGQLSPEGVGDVGQTSARFRSFKAKTARQTLERSLTGNGLLPRAHGVSELTSPV